MFASTARPWTPAIAAAWPPSSVVCRAPIDCSDTPTPRGGDGSDIGAYEADPNLSISRIAKVGGDIRMQFNRLLGRNYQVESKDDIMGSWSVLSNDIAGTGSGLQAVDTGAATLPQRFYRAVMLVP